MIINNIKHFHMYVAAYDGFTIFSRIKKSLARDFKDGPHYVSLSSRKKNRVRTVVNGRSTFM